MSESSTGAQNSGITVWGSGSSKAEPDFATFQFRVKVTHKQAQKSFDLLREKLGELEKGVKDLGVNEDNFQASKFNVERQEGMISTSIDTWASVNIKIDDLEQVEKAVVLITEADAAIISEINYQSSKIDEVRTEARKLAIQDARDKAETFAGEAGVELGSPRIIEELENSRGNSRISLGMKKKSFSSKVKATPVRQEIVNPSWIPVSTAVKMVYNIK